jgi:hypothetical protein
MPENFHRLYGRWVAAIIACFEILTVQSSSLKAQSETCPHLKNQHTAKYLISILPQGSINCVSMAFFGGEGENKIAL